MAQKVVGLIKLQIPAGKACHTACGMCCQNTFFNNDGRIDLVHWLYSL